MKKIIILLILFISSISFCIDFAEINESETVLEMQIENELADRVQDFLDPLIGKTLVFVDLELEYPQVKREFYGIEVDPDQSLPGLPVAKSTDTTDNFGLENKKDMTRIISKNINIIMSDKISEEKRTEIEELLNEWLKIDSSDDMLLIQYRKMKAESLNVDYTILFIILLVIVLISSLMIKSGFAYLASALKRVKVAEFGNTLHIRGDVTSPRASGGGSGLSNLHFSQNKPLPISVIDNPSDDLETQGFDFVENLSVKNFLTLVDDESDDNIALILSKLDATYSARIIEEMQDKARNITVSLSVNNPRSQKVVKEFRNRLYEKYSKFEEDRDYKVNGIETLISIINNLPAKESADLFEQIKADNGQAAGEIRKSIFLLDDIFELSNDVIKALMKTLHHDLLVKFLAQNESSFREVFFRNMTERSISIIQEDIELNSDFSESEKADSTNEMLMTIRKILNYN